MILCEMLEHFPRGRARKCVELFHRENVFKAVFVEHHVPCFVVQRHCVDEGAITIKKDGAWCFHQWKC